MTAIERWAPVHEYDGLYEVSDRGRVRSLDRTITDANGIRRTYKGVLRKPWRDSDGRRRVVLSSGGRIQTCAIAPLVLRAFIGPPPVGYVACHTDGDASNDAVANLRWDTSSENNLDIARHGHNFWANKTECPRGHLLTSPNLVPSILRKGGRTCLACNRAKANCRYAEKTGRPHDFHAFADDHYDRIMAARLQPTPAPDL